ncbi:sugar phosphate isomerase/epimerase family protein [Paenibacillus tyrfis]|uniref:sugar phosphate isomerase/epimerase family protein n=1 Tax=Paenibacillus tyrfis TaxID=1501230 RepID=UPI00209D4EF5|nr:sugar phosphate isomerase/epimerase [Paenibacillus tyrfis]MCP1307047.1 sugar phosphate isomerase/epimerase [Paenibacillus tyrfis]
MKNKFAAQLYTLRDELEKDFSGVLRELKRMGWSGVQISGLRGYTAEEIAAVLKETGLGTAGMHVSYEALQNELETIVEQAKLFGTRDLICPFIVADLRGEEGYRAVRGKLNEVAGKLTPLGFRLSYHNHAFEFETTVNGVSALEYLLEPSKDNAVLAEVDVYWVKKGGLDPVPFIRPYAGRMPIIHLKDMSNDERQTFAEVGTGVIDFIPILQWGEANGIEWYAVEQDVCPGNPLDSLQISLTNLHRMADQLASK